MNREELVNAVALRTTYRKTTIRKILKTMTEVMMETFSESNNVHIYELGFFHVKEYPPRRFYSHEQKKVIMSPGSKKVVYKQPPALKIK